MDNLLSTFRFILPGIVYGIFTIGSILYMDYCCVVSAIFYNDISFNAFTSIIGFVFLSGGLGYVFSILYRSFFQVHGFNQIPILNNLIQSNLIYIHIIDSGKLDITVTESTRNKIRAYEIINIIWHLNKSHFDSDKTNFQASILNSLGATIIASVFSVVSVIIYSIKLSIRPELIILPILLTLILSIIIGIQWWRAKNTYQIWIDSTIYSVLKNNNRRIQNSRLNRNESLSNKLINTIYIPSHLNTN